MLGLALARWDHLTREAWFHWVLRGCLQKCMAPSGGVPIGVRRVGSVGGDLGAVCLAYSYVGADGHARAKPLAPAAPPGTPLSDPLYAATMARRRARGDRDPAFGPDEHALRERRKDCVNAHKRPLRDACAPGAHWYVHIMAVDPAAQGQGLSGRTLGAVATLAAAAGVPTYLECVGERNRAVYERFGYEVAGGRGYELNCAGERAPPRRRRAGPSGVCMECFYVQGRQGDALVEAKNNQKLAFGVTTY